MTLLQRLPSKSIDLVMFSPPYEDARLYGELQFTLKGENWVRWMKPVIRECVRVCRGLVVCNCEGKTTDWSYSGTPFLLMADMIREGIVCRHPGVFHRQGIPGGSPDCPKCHGTGTFHESRETGVFPGTNIPVGSATFGSCDCRSALNVNKWEARKKRCPTCNQVVEEPRSRRQ